MLFKPTLFFNSVLEITPEILAKNNIRGLLLDLDNTLTTHNNKKPADGIMEWIRIIKSAGIKMVIVSNNRPTRVKPFAELMNLEYVCEGRKPLSKGFREAQKRMNIPFSDLAVVGDQIFTDMLGANLKKLKSIFVFPMEYEKAFFFRLKRKLEKPFLPKIIQDDNKEIL